MVATPGPGVERRRRPGPRAMIQPRRLSDAPARAVIGVPGKTRRRRGLVPAGRSNAAWRAERGAGVRSVLTQEAKAIAVAKPCTGAVRPKLTSGQLPFLGSA